MTTTALYGPPLTFWDRLSAPTGLGYNLLAIAYLAVSIPVILNALDLL